jgi:hypothetical protein
MGLFKDWTDKKIREDLAEPVTDEMGDEIQPPMPPDAQARRSAIRAAQARKPDAAAGAEMAQGIRTMPALMRGEVNLIHDKISNQDLPTLKRINAAIDRIVGQDAMLPAEDGMGYQ